VALVMYSMAKLNQGSSRGSRTPAEVGFVRIQDRRSETRQISGTGTGEMLVATDVVLDDEEMRG
jgi:hypothetical protein